MGIGANSAIFKLVDTVMLRGLPVEHPEELLAIRSTSSYWRYEWNVWVPITMREARAVSAFTPGRLARYVESIVFGLKPHDPATIGVSVARLLLVGVGAGYLPARRAARIDPLVALAANPERGPNGSVFVTQLDRHKM